MIVLNKNIEELSAYLQANAWLTDKETITKVEVPGEGNMNFTLRIITNKRSFIIKQSRAYVEKYPQVAAPTERVLREAEFYEEVQKHEALSNKMPKLIGLDKDNSIMLMDDLGKGTDYASLYKEGETITEEDLYTVIDFIAKLHTNITTGTTEKRISNTKMRALNHEHIFKYPYLHDNGIDLDAILPGLKKGAAFIKEDATLLKEIEKLGGLYLQDGNILLHGDFFPGSWLKTTKGVKIIDPEFCFFGFPEFEMGVTIAHLKMANQPEDLIEKALLHYTKQAPLNTDVCYKFVGVEIIRRIIGLAQLPLQIDLEKRLSLLKEAQSIIV